MAMVNFRAVSFITIAQKRPLTPQGQFANCPYCWTVDSGMVVMGIPIPSTRSGDSPGRATNSPGCREYILRLSGRIRRPSQCVRSSSVATAGLETVSTPGLDASHIFHRGQRFVRTDHIAQRRGNPCGCPVGRGLGVHKGRPYGSVQDDDRVNMVWHDHKRTHLNT